MIIGLTGGIATGKSTVANMLKKYGACIIDADKIARQVVEPNQPAWHKIRKRFGEEVFLENGHLDRAALGAIIFADKEARKELNRIVHPEIRRIMEEQKEKAIKEGFEWIVLDIPLLFENKLEYMVEKILVVYVPEHIQKERLMARDKISAHQAEQKMMSQLSIEEKKNKGHAYIDNSGTMAETEAQVLKILKEWSKEIEE